MVKIKNSIDTRLMTVLLDGVVGEDILPIDAQEIVNQSKNVDKVVLQLNSPGGIITDGFAIYNILKSISDKIHVEVIGLAASMGSVLSLVGKTLTMRQGSYFMIHNPWTVGIGDAKEMRDTAELLDKMREDIVNLYESRCYKSRDEIIKMMDDETWLNAKEALELGFADAIDETVLPIAASIGNIHFNKMPDIFKAKIENIENKVDELVEKNIEEKNVVTNIVEDNKIIISNNPNNDEEKKIMDEDKLIDEITNKVMSKVSAGKSLDADKVSNGVDKWFADYIANKVEPKNATVKSTDGYGVPTLTDSNVFKRRSVGSIMRKEIEGVAPASIRKYSADTKVTAKVNPTAAVIAEGQDYPDNSDKGTPVTFDSIKMGSIYSVTEEVNEETVLNVIADFEDDAGKALAKLENLYFTKGTGSGEPQGIVVGGKQVSGITGVTASAITYDALVEFDEKLPTEYADGAFYMMSPNTRALLRKLKDTANRPILQEYNNGLYSLFGRPVIINTNMDDFGAGKKPIVLGNRSGYGIGDRTSGVKVRVSENTKNGDTEMRWSVRTDGRVLDAEAFQVLVCP